MSVSYLYSTQGSNVPGCIKLLVMPEWMLVSFKAQGLSLTRALDLYSQAGFSSIISTQDLIFHDEVTSKVHELLFGAHKYSVDKQARAELMKEVTDAWFAVPFAQSKELNLHPVIVDSNVIALVNYQDDDADEVCQTNMYERLLHCIHRLVVSQVGTRAWDTPLVRAVLERIQVVDKAA